MLSQSIENAGSSYHECWPDVWLQWCIQAPSQPAHIYLCWLNAWLISCLCLMLPYQQWPSEHPGCLDALAITAHHGHLGVMLQALLIYAALKGPHCPGWLCWEFGFTCFRWYIARWGGGRLTSLMNWGDTWDRLGVGALRLGESAGCNIMMPWDGWFLSTKLWWWFPGFPEWTKFTDYPRLPTSVAVVGCGQLLVLWSLHFWLQLVLLVLEACVVGIPYNIFSLVFVSALAGALALEMKALQPVVVYSGRLPAHWQCLLWFRCGNCWNSKGADSQDDKCASGAPWLALQQAWSTILCLLHTPAM